MLRFARSFVGADAHIGPLKCCEFASDFHKNGHFPRADRVVRPYGAKSKLCTTTPIRPYAGCFRFGGGMGRCGHRPLRRETGNAAIFAGRVRERKESAVQRQHPHKTKDTPIPAGRKPRDESIRDTSWCHPGSEDVRPPFSRADGAEPGDFGGCTPYTHARRMSFALCAAGASQQNGSLSDRHAAVLLPRHCR